MNLNQKKIIEGNNVSKKYGKNKWGIKNCNLKIYKNKITGFVGKNGAGKTTTIKLILGLIKPTENAMYINNNEINSHTKNKDIGYLPENVDFPNILCIEDFLFSIASTRGIRQVEFCHRIENLLKYYDLYHERKIPIGNLSKGMKQKIGIIQAIIHDPSIIILDEPTAGLDPISINKTVSLLLKQKNGGKTIILSSHHLDELEKVIDEVVFFDENKVIAQKSMSDIKNKTEIVCIKYISINDSLIEKIKRENDSIINIHNTYMQIYNNHNKERLLMNDIITKYKRYGIEITSIAPKEVTLHEYYMDLICNFSKEVIS